MRPVLIAAALVLLCFVSRAAPQDPGCTSDTDDSLAEKGNYACVRFEASDKELNATCRALLGKTPPAAREELHREQRAWLKGIRFSCIAGAGTKEATGMLPAECDCMTEGTVQQTWRLKRWPEHHDLAGS